MIGETIYRAGFRPRRGGLGVTPKDREAMQERKRAGYTRRLRQIRDKYDLPPLDNRQRNRLLDMVMSIEGDAVVDPDLRIVYRLVARGMGR